MWPSSRIWWLSMYLSGRSLTETLPRGGDLVERLKARSSVIARKESTLIFISRGTRTCRKRAQPRRVNSSLTGFHGNDTYPAVKHVVSRHSCRGTTPSIPINIDTNRVLQGRGKCFRLRFSQMYVYGATFPDTWRDLLYNASIPGILYTEQCSSHLHSLETALLDIISKVGVSREMENVGYRTCGKKARKRLLLRRGKKHTKVLPVCVASALLSLADV